MRCPHEDFEAEVDVNRLTDTGAFHADVRVRCASCRTRMRFVVPDKGLLWDRATTDATGLELRVPLVPDGHMTSALADLPGFRMREPPARRPAPVEEEATDGE